MGAGSPETVVGSSLRSFHDYQGIEPGLRGAFTVSVFALIRGVSARQVLAEMPHKSFGVARFGQLRQQFTVWPTTIRDTDMNPMVRDVHFDVVLARDELVPPGERIEDLDPDGRLRLSSALLHAARCAMDLFGPRVRRYPDGDGPRPEHPTLEGRDLW